MGKLGTANGKTDGIRSKLTLMIGLMMSPGHVSYFVKVSVILCKNQRGSEVFVVFRVPVQQCLVLLGPVS